MKYYNYILVTSIVGWCIAQLLKTIINLIKYKKFSFERLFGAGGLAQRTFGNGMLCGGRRLSC